METIVKIKVGSHLYGTATPASDLDIKGIYLPSAQDILLQRVRPTISEQRKKALGEKNTADDVDYELFSPARYLSLIAQGQSIALEMLFAPDTAMLHPPRPEWNDIKALAPHILTKQAASFVSYCKQQAYKYGVKGSRIAAAKLALEVLVAAEERYGSSAKLGCALEDLKKLTEKILEPGVSPSSLPTASYAGQAPCTPLQKAEPNTFLTLSSNATHDNEPLYFEICGKKILLTASIKTALSITQKIIAEYGERALAAERNEGVDWKALSHAVRIGHQAVEFIKYQHITFPRPEAEHLLAIKQGQVGFHQVAEEIEQLLVDVEAALQHSILPDTYDPQVIDQFIEKLHLEQIIR